MVEAPASRIWIARGTYITIAILLIFLQLLPLNTLPPRWAPPDLILAVTLAWVARRPDFMPILSVAFVFLLCDFLFQRPPGLYTALMLILTETLRARSRNLRNSAFSVEWATIALGIVAITFGYRLVQSVALLHQAPFWLTMVQMVLTILIYPVVAVLSQILFGIARPAPGQVDSLGHRL
ncbi:rod shape-determining protein MreD [Aestuariibius sp. HNIBRBA575]|uniref:rod shape-determining protein MreD n=1 Tax=Aestuariibius sp. HNIBRBA575 TaxID=3233343 RepID=UPI0034A16D62